MAAIPLSGARRGAGLNETPREPAEQLAGLALPGLAILLVAETLARRVSTRLRIASAEVTGSALDLAGSSRQLLLRRGLRLEYATLSWNVVGGGLVLVAAALARSVALAGFGLDSLIEIVASAVVVWQLKSVNEAGERKALRVIGVSFVLLAVYIAAQSSYVLAVAFRPRHSLLGIVWLALTALAMFALAYGKSKTGLALGNRTLQTEARVTIIDGILATAVLAGLALNAAFGLWWADPLAAYIIVYYGLREGKTALAEAAASSERRL